MQRLGATAVAMAVIAVLPPAPAQAASMQLVSVASDGTPGDGASGFPDMSASGRYVAFASSATNLVGDDSNGTPDVFERDRRLGVTWLVSVASDGRQSHGMVGSVSVSASGRRVVFSSDADDLVPGDSAGSDDVFVHDRVSGRTQLVDASSGGVRADGTGSWNARISGNGRFVAFTSDARNLGGPSGGGEQLYLRDLRRHTTTWIAPASARFGAPWASLSRSGRYVAFESGDPSLVRGDTNGSFDVFLFDRRSGTTQRMSVASGGAQADGPSSHPVVSADGRYVAFMSAATNLDLQAACAAPCADVYVHDRVSGTTTAVNVDAGGAVRSGSAAYPAVSAHGRYVAFEAAQTNATGVTYQDVFVRDMRDGSVQPVSVTPAGTQPNHNAYFPAISAHGWTVAFAAMASDILPGAGANQVYVSVGAIGERRGVRRPLGARPRT